MSLPFVDSYGSDYLTAPRLRHVFSIGGPPGSGKTTIAARLADVMGCAGTAPTRAHGNTGPGVPRRRLLPSSPLIVAEGSPVSPSIVEDHSRAVWLIPTPEFQRAQLEERGLPPGPSALYLLLATEIAQQAGEHGVPVLTVDRSRGVA